MQMYLLRKHVPMEAVAAATGLPLRDLERLKSDSFIHLRRPAASEGLPEPTVNYWGEA